MPVAVLTRDLQLPLPTTFLSRAPDDEQQRGLELVARHRLYSALEGTLELNPFSKTAVFLWLHDRWQDRAGYLAACMTQEAREARAAGEAREARGTPGQGSNGQERMLLGQLREGMMQWRQYKDALARSFADL